MKARCVDNGGYKLTYGKEYEVSSYGHQFYSFINDDGKTDEAFKSRFKEIPPRHRNQRCSVSPELTSKLRHVTTDGEIFDCISKATNHQKSIDDNELFKGCGVGPYLDATLEDMVYWAKSEPESYELLKQYVEK